MSQHFINLIKQGATSEIADAVKADPQVARSRDAQGVSALMWSIYTQQTVIRDFLLSGLDNLDIFEAAAAGDCSTLQAHLAGDATLARAVSADGWPPLHLASAFAGPEAVALLLAHGAHVHQLSRNPLRNQALHACIALSQSIEIARLLIESGADVNYVQSAGFTPLHQAAANGNEALVHLLLDHGAHCDCLCDKGKSPADYARERGHAGLAELLATTASA
jgi:uncharacterized protein